MRMILGNNTLGGTVRLAFSSVAINAALVAIGAPAFGESTELGVDSSGHFITKHGKRVFLLGDTVWPLAVRFNDEQVRAYLDNTKGLGFNVIALFETTAWAAFDEKGKNVFGEHPYGDGNPWQLNMKYWQRYEFVIREAGQREMFVYLCVGGPLRPKTIWSPLDTPQKAYDYGNALGKFLRKVNPHIIWSPGTDQNPDTVSLPRVDDVSEGIADGVNGVYQRDGKADYRSTFISYHTCGKKCSADYFQDKPWLDINGFQSWRSYEVTVPMARKQYAMKPPKPGIDHEPAYEGDLSHKESEVKTGWHTRLQAYWSLFSGSCGHINGTTGIWDLGTRNWRSYEDGLRSEGRTDLQWVRKLIESQPLDSRVPDQSLIVGDTGEPDRDKDFLCATRGGDGSYAWIYSTNGRGFSADLSKLAGKTVTAQWFNPRTGEFQRLDTYETKTRQPFDPPGEAGTSNDWVLVLQAP